MKKPLSHSFSNYCIFSALYVYLPGWITGANGRRLAIKFCNGKRCVTWKSLLTYTGQRARRGGLWFSRWAPDRAVLVSSPGRGHSLTVPLSTQVYKWVPAILMLKPGVIPAMNYHPIAWSDADFQHQQQHQIMTSIGLWGCVELTVFVWELLGNWSRHKGGTSLGGLTSIFEWLINNNVVVPLTTLFFSSIWCNSLAFFTYLCFLPHYQFKSGGPAAVLLAVTWLLWPHGGKL